MACDISEYTAQQRGGEGLGQSPESAWGEFKGADTVGVCAMSGAR
jgi:hypothetical protein